MHMCEIHRAAHAFGCIIPNEADIEITNCRLAEIESEWHRATRPSKLFQEANYNEQGEYIFIHGDVDGKHTFKYGEHMDFKKSQPPALSEPEHDHEEK